MTNLTDKWKKGKLPEGFYYVRCAWSDEVEIRYVHNGVDEWQEIIAEVPSYEEYQKLLSYQLAKNEGVEINAELEAENIKLKTENKWYSEQLNEAVKQNDKLKELLKECKHIMAIEKDFASCHFEKHKLDELLAKIDQVLGEE